MTVKKNLTITGPTYTSGTPWTVIDGQSTGKVFTIPSGVKVTLQNLLIQNGSGYCGGGIINGGDLFINHCYLINNGASYGGAIYNDGPLSIYISNISNNSAGMGGGIYNENSGILTVTYSIFTGNTCAIYNVNSAAVHYNKIYNNGLIDIYGYSFVDAENNWWGSNADPSSRMSGNVDVTPWMASSVFITAIDPINGAINVATSKTLKITFSESIKAGSNYLIELKNSAGTLIPINKSINGNVLTIDPKSNLAESLYTLIIYSGSVTDITGSPAAAKTIKFSVGTSPTVSSTNPVNKATNVARNKTITVTFNENIKTGTNYSKITLKSSTGKTITISKSISGKVLTIKHSSKFAAKTKYILTLYSGCIRDLAGNPLAAKTITFTTGSY